MNRVYRRFSFGRGQAAQTIYQTMMVLSCIALAIAIFFPVYEYLTVYRAPFKTHKFATTSYAPRPATTPGRPAPAAQPVAEPGAGAKEEGEAAPAATEAPKPVEAAPGENKSETTAPTGG